ncbi:hypothetical protein ABEB36_004281 [Hypothenemus hampei]|uniref:Cytochrome P450 n=1 Tax=Hypothenemus hampei TaxID=57062 RepID=A0ABD1F2T8_HYPHA
MLKDRYPQKYENNHLPSCTTNYPGISGKMEAQGVICHDLYGGIYQLNLPTFVLKDSQLIKQITIKDFDHFTDHTTLVNPETDLLWSNNLLSLNGYKWSEMRAILSGSFTSSKMKHIYGVINEVALNFSMHFMKKKGNIQTLSSLITKLQMIKRPLYISVIQSQKLLDCVKVEKIERNKMINLLLEAIKGHKTEEGNAIETGYATVQEDSYFDKVKFKQAKYLTNDHITAQVLIFFFAGFDTVATALCYGAHELAMNKDVQDNLRGEIRETHKLNNGKLIYDAVLNMKYTAQQLKWIFKNSGHY